MKKIIKFRLLFFLITVFLFSSFETLAQSIVFPLWQLQNPSDFRQSMVFGFGDKGDFTCCTSNITVYNSIQTFKGSYSQSGNTVIIKLGGQVYQFNIVWVNANKMKLIDAQGNTAIYAKCGFPEDTFMMNALNAINGGYTTPSPTTPNRPTTCVACYGSGSCKVCGGSGTYSMYGYSSPCSACNQTGKCWNCGGKGVK